VTPPPALNSAYAQIGLCVAVLLLSARPLGAYIFKVMWGGPPNPPWVLERWIYAACGINSRSQMNWRTYAICLLLFNALGTLALYGLQRAQGVLPLNPGALPGVAADGAFNTAVSFASNTSWQSYAGESTLSYLTQMLGITSQSFLSAASGLAVLMALLRAFARSSSSVLGNVWVDLTRGTLYILLPMAAALAWALTAQGVIQNLSPSEAAEQLEVAGAPATSVHTQPLPMGPVASQTSIALLGGDGGGYFNVNSAHPYANPTPVSNFLEMIAILMIPSALCYTFGRAVGGTRQGWALWSAMAAVLVATSGLTIHAEQQADRTLAHLRVDQAATVLQAGGNMEGKETRFGIVSSALFATVTTAGGDGAVNSMHDSYTPIGGLVPMVLMQLGEVIFGSPGSGLYGMLLFAIMAVFVAGLMVGRSPEYLGKKIEAFEMKMVSLTILTAPLLVLIGTALAVLLPAGRAGISNPGPHGLSQILYAFSSAANNNGSAFAGLSGNTPFYNIGLGVAMWFGRFVPIAAVLAIAGSLAAKTRRPALAGTLRTDGVAFIGLLLACIVVIGALTHLPAIALGPIAEALQMRDTP
jgi:potassium-transporting ATPase potassium-binding subunit